MPMIFTTPPPPAPPQPSTPTHKRARAAAERCHAPRSHARSVRARLATLDELDAWRIDDGERPLCDERALVATCAPAAALCSGYERSTHVRLVDALRADPSLARAVSSDVYVAAIESDAGGAALELLDVSRARTLDAAVYEAVARAGDVRTLYAALRCRRPPPAALAGAVRTAVERGSTVLARDLVARAGFDDERGAALTRADLRVATALDELVYARGARLDARADEFAPHNALLGVFVDAYRAATRCVHADAVATPHASAASSPCTFTHALDEYCARAADDDAEASLVARFIGATPRRRDDNALVRVVAANGGECAASALVDALARDWSTRVALERTHASTRTRTLARAALALDARDEVAALGGSVALYVVLRTLATTPPCDALASALDKYARSRAHRGAGGGASASAVCTACAALSRSLDSIHWT